MDEQNLLELVTDELVKFIALKKLRQLQEGDAAVRSAKKRAIRRRNNRSQMFSNRHHATMRVNKLLQGHPGLFKTVTRLTVQQFQLLVTWLKENASLCDSKYVSLNAKLAIFLDICGHGSTFRVASAHWELNIDRIHVFFHEVLNALVKLAEHNIVMFKEEDDPPVPPQIRAEVGKLYPFFKDCVGAIDGTLVYVSVKGEDRKRQGEEGAYRCRKGFLATNTLGCVDFDMNFKLVFPGWEGTAHDATVFNDARRQGLFVTPRGKYWLADAGYTQADGYGGQVLAPYMSVRYHLQEWRKGNQRPQNMKELFNLRHARLRNVVERVYGVFKNRFRIFQAPRDGFSLLTQNKLIIALSAVHNWINEHGGKPKKEWKKMKRSKKGSMAQRRYELILQQQEDARINSVFVPDRGPVHLSQKEGARYMYEKRDKIASEMWQQYEAYLEARGREGGGSEYGSSDDESEEGDEGLDEASSEDSCEESDEDGEVIES